MKVKDLLKDSAELLGLTKQVEILSSETADETEILLDAEIASLFNLFKFSVRELCTNYIPVSVIENISTREGKYPISSFSNYVKLVKVTKNNEKVAYKILNRNLVFESDGSYDVEYCTYPEITTISQEIDFLPVFNADVLVDGLCAYYSISKGMLEEFESFHENYKFKAESIRAMKTFVMPQRRWQWKQKNV